MVQSAAHQQIGYILRSYPRLSQTFILNEILALEQLGLNIQIFAITDPREPIVQAQAADVRAPVRYLEEAGKRSGRAILSEHLHWMTRSPARYLRAVWYVLQSKEVDAGYTASSRLECFLQAVYLARLLQDGTQDTESGIGHLHAHFAHDPALIALLVHILTGIPYSFTTHARDLYQSSASALVERVQRANAVVTCCCANVQYLDQALPEVLHAKVHLIRHGVDLQGFQPATAGAKSSQAPLILSVGRLVEKKGFADLLQVCRLLKERGCRFRCEIYGEGPLRAELDAFIQQHGLANQVILAGARTQQELVTIYQEAAVFILIPVITEDGDRDGIPNVLAEAMACGLPVVTTTVAGITELVIHDHNGLVFEPHDVQAVATGLAELLDDEPQRKRLGEAARRTVSRRFDTRIAARRLAALFDQALERQAVQRADSTTSVRTMTGSTI